MEDVMCPQMKRLFSQLVETCKRGEENPNSREAEAEFRRSHVRIAAHRANCPVCAEAFREAELAQEQLDLQTGNRYAVRI